MKDFILLLVLFVPSILVVVAESDEDFVEVSIPPRLKYIDSNGNVALQGENEHHRSIRRPNTCKFPTTMKDAQLDCKLYPSRISCTQTCMFGHTLGDTIQREMKCRYDEDKWSPVGEFETCLPFIDCTISLGPGGKYKCYTNYMDKGANCEVSCAHYEDKPAVPSAMYECNIEGKWKPKLPFCAKAGTGAKLVPPPRGTKIIS